MNTYQRGSTEYLTVTVTADVDLDTQPVAVSLNDGTTWLPATWVGDVASTRTARTTDPVTWNLDRPTAVLVRVTDYPETPIVAAGTVAVA